ncbi:MAG: GtrA family protein [Bdellovibrionales bacterium]
MSSNLHQLSRFLLVGVTTVFIDLISYHALMLAGLELDIAKACSFTIGALFAYVANKSWTFGQRDHGLSPMWFVLLYAGTMLVNTAANGMIVRALLPSQAAVTVAFVIATGLSAALNFIGMKWIVFRGGAA